MNKKIIYYVLIIISLSLIVFGGLLQFNILSLNKENVSETDKTESYTKEDAMKILISTGVYNEKNAEFVKKIDYKTFEYLFKEDSSSEIYIDVDVKSKTFTLIEKSSTRGA